MSVEGSVALDRLRAGNARFASGTSHGHFTAEERAALVHGQRPWAVVVGCSDSRVPVEAVFDARAGDLFVVRTAGHTLDSAGAASVRFALERLGARLLVVLGHEDCGAVAAWFGGEAPEWLAPVTDHICNGQGADCLEPGAGVGEAVEAHAIETALEVDAWLAADSIGVDVDIVPAVYRLESGRVDWLEP